MNCFRYICCIKQKRRNIFEEEEITNPIMVSAPVYEYKEDPTEVVKEKISSVYRKLSGWSLPQKSIRVNLFALNQRDLGTHYEEDEDSPYEGDLDDDKYEEDNFDEFVDQKLETPIVQ